MNIFKPKTHQRFILKIDSKVLKRNKWNISVPLNVAKKNKQIIPISDSTLIRFIDEINSGSKESYPTYKTNNELEVKRLKKTINFIRKESRSKENSNKISEAYKQLDNICFYPEIISLVCNSKSDFKKAVDGFKVNGKVYRRLLGTPGGIKKSTILFISETSKNGQVLYEDIKARLNNGRDTLKKILAAKLEAYMALICSSTTVVTQPRDNGILVVEDCITSFNDKYISLKEGDSQEPLFEIIDGEVRVNISDGGGLICPELAEQWSIDLDENHIVSGFCVRNAFCKGMLNTFDFHMFGNEIGKQKKVVDAWGNIHNIDDIQIILTTSMLKLWDSYSDIDDYLNNCHKNGYEFCISKTTPEKLEDERTLNYQFIQSYKLSDEDINALIEPSVNEILDSLGKDVDKSILFLKGLSLSETNIEYIDDDFVKALMIDNELINDSYIRSKIYYLIKKRINELKIGKLKVKGNYSIICGDPYALCQSIWGQKVTGLLNSGEIYSKYWSDIKVDEVVCFRAPMSCHNNIRKMKIASNDIIDKWFKYLKTITVINGFDTFTQALNGADFDSDSILTTNNIILLRNYRFALPIFCEQKNAEKIIPTEEDIVTSNMNGFGDDIGKETNRITAMTDIQSDYEEESEEYKILDYRIMCGQLYQQASIDKIKGIQSNPMPTHWYHYNNGDNASMAHIVADRKPYFMIYIYPEEYKKHTEFIKNSNRKCLMEFGYDIDTLLNRIKNKKASEKEKMFYDWYIKKCPVYHGNSVMNKIAHNVEKRFKNFKETEKKDYDYSKLKSGCEYEKQAYNAISLIYNKYLVSKKLLMGSAISERLSSYEISLQKSVLNDEFKKECLAVCSNEKVLCDILVDYCYTNNAKQFVWEIMSDVIIDNLLEKNGNKITYLEMNENGEVEYCSNKFIKKIFVYNKEETAVDYYDNIE